MEDQRENRQAGSDTGRREASDTYLRDPWACYEDGDEFCGSEESATEEDDCGCCCC